MYYKKQNAPNGKWYPQSVTRGKQVSTRRIAEKLSKISTVSLADTLAVLSELGSVMAEQLAAGRSVKLDGLGSFRLSGYTGKNKAVDTPEQVTSKMCEGVRVRFVPEAFQTAGGGMTRAMLEGGVDWIELTTEEAEAGTEGGGENQEGTGGGGGDDDNENIFG